MIFFDLTILGVYYIVRPIYLLLNKEKNSFNAEDHSLLITWSAHSACMNQIIGFFMEDSPYFKTVIISLAIMLLLLGYYYYYFKNKLKKVLNKKINSSTKILITTLTMLYIFLSFYFFFKD